MIDGMIQAVDEELPKIERYRAIKSALQRYSRDKPLIEVDDVSGDGGRYYVLSTSLGSWSEEFSNVLEVEYPAATIASDEILQPLEPSEWSDEVKVDVSGTLTRHLYFPQHTPASTETFRVSYTTPRNWSAGSTTHNVAQTSHGFSLNDFVYDDGTDWVETEAANLLATHKVTTVTDANNVVLTELSIDIPEADFFAICNLGACLTCEAIAAKYSRTSDSTILADAASHPERASQFRTQAEIFCNEYQRAMGLLAEEDGAGERVRSAHQFVDLDTAPGWPTSRDYLFHSSETR